MQKSPSQYCNAKNLVLITVMQKIYYSHNVMTEKSNFHCRNVNKSHTHYHNAKNTPDSHYHNAKNS